MTTGPSDPPTARRGRGARRARHTKAAARSRHMMALMAGALVVVIAGAFWVTGCGGSSGHPAAKDGAHPSPGGTASAAPVALYADPSNPLNPSIALLKESGQDQEAGLLQKIASTPSGVWASGQAGEMQLVRQAMLGAAKAHEMPIVVAYNLPDRDACGKLSGATSLSAADYEGYVNQLAAAIGRGNAIVVVEPDGLPDIVRGCLSPAQATERYQLLQYAMQKLGSLPGARVYLDAGNPGEFSNPSVLVTPLEQAGIKYGKGFSANVSNFQWTDYVVSWSQQLEQDLGGGFNAIVDTSRNGNGPYTGPDQPQWCNPPGRAAGPAPTLEPHATGIYAYLWIKNSWASDGPCNGGPAAGQVDLQYALSLAQDSTKTG